VYADQVEPEPALMSVIPAACLIGWPAAHSRSPLIHKYWLKSFGIDGDYRIEAVEPAAFADFIGGLAARGLKTADGLGMLLHQAVRGFELWFGQRPTVTPELRALVEADLQAPPVN
jgi:shikimate 5-dehydrogenase